MSKFPFYFQHDSMDCGAACLTMLARHYRCNLEQDKITDLCKVSKNGISMWALKNAAEDIGFKCTGISFCVEELILTQISPCILHWNQNHFVILYKISKSRFHNKGYRFHIADPTYGRVIFDIDEIKQHWLENNDKGKILLIEPTPQLYDKPKENRPKRIELLSRYFRKYRSVFVKLSIFIVISSGIQLLFPLLTQAIVDIGIGDRDISFIYLILLAQAMLILSRTIVEFVKSWLLLRISVKVSISLISDFINKLLKLPMSFFESKKTGDFLQRIQDHDIVENFITSKSLETVFSFLTLITFGALLLYYNVAIFAVFMLGSAAYAAWVAIFLQRRKLLNYKFFQKKSQNQSTTYQLITAIQEIKLQGSAERKKTEWIDIQTEIAKLRAENLKIDQYSEIGNIFINEGKNMIITVMTATAVITGEMTIGMMLAVQYIIGQLIVPIDQAVQFILSVQEVKISIDRIDEIYRRDDEISEDHHIVPENILSGDLILDNVCFKYDKTARIILYMMRPLLLLEIKLPQ